MFDWLTDLSDPRWQGISGIVAILALIVVLVQWISEIARRKRGRPIPKPKEILFKALATITFVALHGGVVIGTVGLSYSLSSILGNAFQGALTLITTFVFSHVASVIGLISLVIAATLHMALVVEIDDLSTRLKFFIAIVDVKRVFNATLVGTGVILVASLALPDLYISSRLIFQNALFLTGETRLVCILAFVLYANAAHQAIEIAINIAFPPSSPSPRLDPGST